MADIKEAIRRLIYQYTVEGADKVMATQEAVAASTSKTEKSSLSLEKSFSGLERRYVDTVRAQQDYAKVQEKVNAAVAQNPELQERANVVLAQAKQHFENVATGAGKADMAATVFIRTISRTIGPIAIVGAAVAALSSAFEFMEPIAVRVGTDIYRRFSEAYPAAGHLAEELMKAANEFIEVERASAKIEATNAALRGTASAAQLAALNLESMNQKLVNQRSLAEAAQAAERMAQTVMVLAAAYPGVTLETAKQLALNEDLLAIAQARTDQEKLIAEEDAEINRLLAAGKSIDEAWLLAAGKREIAQENLNQKLSEGTSELDDTGKELQKNVGYTQQWSGEVRKLVYHMSLAESVASRLSMLNTQFGDEKFTVATDAFKASTQKSALESAYGAEFLKATTYFKGTMMEMTLYSLDTEKYLASLRTDPSAYVGRQDVSSPAAASQSLANVLALGLRDGLTNVNRVIDAVSDPSTQASLVQQAIDYINATQPAGLAREEMINQLNNKLESLTSSTDSLNSTMQNALSPFYSQDPRTTHLGFRAGVVGNEDWLAPGASSQAGALAAILGPGATAPGMANGGSFVVGGGYSANDNRIATFPVASGEEVIVNRNRKGGQGGQVIHIDNRTIINGRVDSDVFAQLKVTKFQQAQRMRAGLAAA